MAVIDTGYIKKAQAVFERFRKNLNTEQEKAGAVQAFEFCYELSWKLMKRVLLARGQETGSPKDTFRKAADEALITDPELWFMFQKKRNLTVHTYNEENLDLIIDSFDDFSREMAQLIVKVDELS